jgi:16S rRNA processing protein RimM
MPRQYIEIGKITGAHGIRGEVKLRAFTENPEDIAAYGPLTDASGSRVFSLRITGKAPKGQLIAAIEGISDRTAAEALAGISLYVESSRLPPPLKDEYCHAHLIGLRAVTPEGEVVGEVAAAYNFGAGDILEIKYPDGKTEMFPFQDAVFPQIDVENGTITFVAPEVME